MFFSTCRRTRRAGTNQTQPEPPFPWPQMIVLALCRLCEPIAFMSVFPYSHSMMQSFGFKTEKEIVFFAGCITSAFAFAEFATGMFWGRTSDRYGRKPVLLGGMLGTGLSMLAFGFAPNLWLALVARALGGLLNGNIGVISVTISEIVTYEKHKPIAYTIVPSVWAIGSVIGAYLGGILSNPVKAYPSLFSAGSIWESFPYLLPNLVCVAVVFTGFIVGFLFLEETHVEKKFEPDYGRRLGRSILRHFPWFANEVPTNYEALSNEKSETADEHSLLLPPYHTPDAYKSTVASLDYAEPVTIGNEKKEALAEASLRKAFTPQILSIVCGTGLLAFHTISFEQQLPLLMAAPHLNKVPQLPFKFQAGLNLTDKEIGSILSTQGVLQMIAQMVLFPKISSRLGSLVTFRLVIFAYPILYFLIPYVALLPTSLQVAAVYPILAWKVIGQAFSYPSAMMILHTLTSSKNKGEITGVTTSAQSFCRAVGPLISGGIQSLGTSHGYSGVVWWFCAIVAMMGALESLLIPSERKSTAPDVESAILKDPALFDMIGCEPMTTIGDEGDLEEDEGTLYSSSRAESFDDSSRPTSIELDEASDTMALLPNQH